MRTRFPQAFVSIIVYIWSHFISHISSIDIMLWNYFHVAKISQQRYIHQRLCRVRLKTKVCIMI